MIFPDDVPTLADGEVTLRAHRLSDVDQVVEQCVDPESVRWTTVPAPYTRDMAVEFVTKSAEEGWAKRSDLMFAIEAPHADGVRRFSGTCNLRPMIEGKAEIAFGLHPDARGRKICDRAVKLLLDWGFQQDGIDVVVWFAYVGNWGSRRVAWSNGFTIDATLTRFVTQRGVWTDCWFGTLRADDSRDPKSAWHVPPVLESDRLRLRPLRETDADRMGEMLTDERTQAFVGRYLAGDQVSAATKILRQLDRNARGEGYNWCMADRETDRLIGHIHLWDLGGLDPTSAQLGYSVHPDSRGRGVLTEALDMVVEWAFRPVADGGPGLRRLALDTAASNAASRHAAEKAGFAHVATEPAAFPTGESGFEDSVTYHQLNQRWTP
jgi:ribosomal-protein-alanine N-acetyltransferase